MSLPLFRAESVPEIGEMAVLDGPEGRHAGSALRLSAGECFLLGDGRGTLAECVVRAVGSGRVDAQVLRTRQVPQPHTTVAIVQALPKSERSELAVELATEAGADIIIPWQAERCVSRWSGSKVAKGHIKWANAARAAAKQSRRAWEPEIEELVSSSQLVDMLSYEIASGALVIALDEGGAVPFSVIVTRYEQEREGLPRKIILIIGPEGGISDSEYSALSSAGVSTAILGPEVLRTSTAAAVALGALGVLTTRWADLSDTATTLEVNKPEEN